MEVEDVEIKISTVLEVGDGSKYSFSFYCRLILEKTSSSEVVYLNSSSEVLILSVNQAKPNSFS
jgi:hypothetical protein